MPPAFWAAYALKLGLAAAVLALLYVLAQRLRAGSLPRRAHRCVEVVESAMLSPQAAVHLLRVGKRYVLVGRSANAICALAELTPGELEIIP
ncbi:MAG TPA: flagellar biosynthetic protein FliO [Candidatus Cybelea sp.]|nr:flagellar biosynthetic protein FliO [Candidatus Cybelea sp.]